MGVDAVWKDEFGKERGRVSDPSMLMSQIATGRPEDTVCLRFIDPYGDTVFNQRQIPGVIEELTARLSSLGDEQTRTHVESVINLAKKAKGQVHTYLWFIGD